MTKKSVLSINEIKRRAAAFSIEFKDARREEADAQTFWNEFFNVFGIARQRIATFEYHVNQLGGKRGRIDLFWKGVLLVEHKSFGMDLEAARSQAMEYLGGLKERELPRYILCSDFQTFELHNLENNSTRRFRLADLHKNIEPLSFIAGYQKREYAEQSPVNIQAAEKLGKLHDMLSASGYTGDDLELFMVRVLFCLFAEDTGIFERDQFKDLIENWTDESGYDTGSQLCHLFATLDTPYEKRNENLHEALAEFAYINGGLFRRRVEIPAFNSDMRDYLIEVTDFDWGAISPAIFGSMFQSIMDTEKRRNLGAHYTTEANIMKVISSLFMDELWEEYRKIERSKNKRVMREFHEKLASIKLFDPACGCGNFLVIAYRELRKLELEVIRFTHSDSVSAGQLMLDPRSISKLDVDMYTGIEIDPFAGRIAEVAMWLMDHQMNIEVMECFGDIPARIPLKKSPRILIGNSLHVDWDSVAPVNETTYIVGNPPFVGSVMQTAVQKMIWRLCSVTRR